MVLLSFFVQKNGAERAACAFLCPAAAASSSSHKSFPSRGQRATSCVNCLMLVGAERAASAFLNKIDYVVADVEGFFFW